MGNQRPKKQKRKEKRHEQMNESLMLKISETGRVICEQFFALSLAERTGELLCCVCFVVKNLLVHTPIIKEIESLKTPVITIEIGRRGEP